MLLFRYNFYAPCRMVASADVSKNRNENFFHPEENHYQPQQAIIRQNAIRWILRLKKSIFYYRIFILMKYFCYIYSNIYSLFVKEVPGRRLPLRDRHVLAGAWVVVANEESGWLIIVNYYWLTFLTECRSHTVNKSTALPLSEKIDFLYIRGIWSTVNYVWKSIY